MSLSRYSAWMGLGLGLLGLAISGGFARANESVGHIWLDGSVSADEAALLQFDRQVFSTFRIPESNTDLKNLLGTGTNTTEELDAWLEARVQAVVGEGYNSGEHTVSYPVSFSYPSPGIFPNLEVSHISNPAKGVLIMSNIGVSAYLRGKHLGGLLGMTIDGVGTFPVRSPRVGIIQVGPGLFTPPHPIDSSNPRSVANSIPRLGTRGFAPAVPRLLRPRIAAEPRRKPGHGLESAAGRTTLRCFALARRGPRVL